MIVLLVLFLCLFHILLLTQLSYTVWPEMMLYPWLMNNGFNLYKDIVNPYLPGLSWFLWLYFKLFGFSIINLKLLTWGIIFFLDLLIFLLAKNLFNKRIALLALIIFIIGQPMLEGNGLWFDLVLAPLLLLAFYFFIKKQWIGTMMILGLAFLIKQSVIVYLWLLFLRVSKKKVRLLLFFLPFLLVSIYFASQNLFKDFIFWTVKFPLFIAGRMPGYVHLPSLRIGIIGSLIATGSVFYAKRLKNSKVVKDLILWMLFSIVFVYPRWSLFHLQPILIFFSIFIAQIIYSIFHEKRLYYSKITIVALIIVFSIWSVVKIKSQIGIDDRFLDKQTKDVAVWINNNVGPNEKVFIFNGYQLAYFLSNHLPVKPWVDNFPWYMEVNGVQSRVVNSLEENKPNYLILHRFLNGNEYDLGAYQPVVIVNYLKSQYVYKNNITDSVEIWQKK